MNFRIKYTLDHIKNLLDSKNKIILITEPQNWVISQICSELKTNLNKRGFYKIAIRTNPRFLRNKILHFNSIHTAIASIDLIKKLHERNKIIVTIYHLLDREDLKTKIIRLAQHIDRIHTACSITKNRLISLGIPESKIVLIPLAINLDIFKKNDNEKIDGLKKGLELPLDKTIVGSFQKDGVGWQNGEKPKLIKGPDIFVEVVKKISKKIPIHVLLTGPARGYVINKLKENKITYSYRHLRKKYDMVNFYNCLDLYLICSRIEGGPQAILECWSTGVPIVTTKVGLVPDIMKDMHNGLIADIDDIESLVNNVLKVISNNELKHKLINNGLDDVNQYSWNSIIKNYISDLYSRL